MSVFQCKSAAVEPLVDFNMLQSLKSPQLVFGPTSIFSDIYKTSVCPTL